MKTNAFHTPFLIILFFTFNFTGNIKAQADKKDSLFCLEIIGIAMTDKAPLDGVDVKLYRENEEMEMTEITSVAYHEHSFMFKLARDSYYTIEVSKEGYVTRIVTISTKLPKDVIADPPFTYEFEVNLFKAKKNMDDYYLDFPVALIDYNVKKDVFESHGKYTNYIKGKIDEAMRQTDEKNGH